MSDAETAPEVESLDLRDLILSNSSFGPQEISQIRTAIAKDYSHFSELREAVGRMEEDGARSPATQTKLGVCQFLLGRFGEAAETLRTADGGALALYYQGKCLFEQGDYLGSIEAFQNSQKSGYDADHCNLAIAQSKRYAGDVEEAMAILDNMFGPIEQTAEYLYQRGATVAAVGGNLPETVALYERAIAADPNHAGALFGLALENDRHGNDQDALALYERAATAFPTGIGALVNLGLAYEDAGEFDKAQRCYRRILEAYPDHPRARMYMKDALGQGKDPYDEDKQRQNDRMAQLLNIPVTNFELSVRSRNCLQKMGIKTLGDLTQVTEGELLASKNFGETSLYEIREILASKDLSLGMFAHEKKTTEPPIDTSHMSADEQALLERPIADLNLSVRARKCMVRLGITTIGELIRKTGDDLLESKNFGVTSLNEVREKLGDLGLKLRGE
jgi:DNA-directed RNA polymerase subunit alpha